MGDFTKILFKSFIASLVVLSGSLLMSFEIFYNIVVASSSAILLFCLFSLFIKTAADFDTESFDDTMLYTTFTD